MAGWVEFYRSIVLPRHCDHYGHLNIRYYAGFFDDAGWHILNLAGIPLQELRDRNIGTVVASLTIDFHHEITVGQPFVIRGGLRRVGTKSLTHELRLYEADSDTLCATQTSVEVCFDTQARKSIPLPDDLRAKLQSTIVDDAAAQ